MLHSLFIDKLLTIIDGHDIRPNKKHVGFLSNICVVRELGFFNNFVKIIL